MKKLNNYIIALFLILAFILFSIPFLTNLDVLNNLFVKEKMAKQLEGSVEFSRLKRKMVIYNQKDPDNYIFWGDFFKKIGEEKKAIYFYKKAINFNPLRTIRTYQELAKLYEELGKEMERENLIFNVASLIMEKQLHYPDLGYELRKPTSELIYSLAKEKFEKKDYDEALKNLEMAIKIDPWVICHLDPLPFIDVDPNVSRPFVEKLSNLDRQYFLCFYEYYIGLFRSAGFLEKITDIAPEWPFYWVELSSSYLDQDEFDKAKSTLKSCLKHSPGALDCKKALELLEKRIN